MKRDDMPHEMHVHLKDKTCIRCGQTIPVEYASYDNVCQACTSERKKEYYEEKKKSPKKKRSFSIKKTTQNILELNELYYSKFFDCNICTKTDKKRRAAINLRRVFLSLSPHTEYCFHKAKEVYELEFLQWQAKKIQIKVKKPSSFKLNRCKLSINISYELDYLKKQKGRIIVDKDFLNNTFLYGYDRAYKSYLGED